MISIIVPVYNVRKYLQRCVQSIINQTYAELEIILVDDGSTDGSGDICDELMQQDDRIRVIHQENKGLSEARNSGLDVAEGEYIAFVDSDDYIAEKMYEVLLDRLQSSNADMAMCGYCKWFEEDGNIENPVVLTEECVVGCIEMYGMLFQEEKSVFLPVAWNKLYKRVLWDNIRYPQGRYHEDEYVIHQLIHLCKKVVMIPESYYYYSIRKDSIMAGRNLRKSKDWIEALLERRMFFRHNGDEELCQKQTEFCIRMILWECKKAEEMNEETKDFFREMAGLITSIRKDRKDEKISRNAQCFAMFPISYIRCSKILEKIRKNA